MENVAPREWSSCARLVSRVPAHMARGLLPQPVNLTCLDACPEHLALAADSGVVFWCDRKTHQVLRLRCENARSPITFVKIVSTVDFMVAAGNKDGQVTVFQIPKPHPDSIPDHIKPKASPVERYTIRDLHRSNITYLEWSKNGMKLFSGDKEGIVVLTEIDFYMHISKSLEIVNESYEIVQLSYYQNHLLVSSSYRAIMCRYENSKWNVNQVGTKDRKSLCKLGGVIHFKYGKPNDLNIYSARPGLRIWTSDKDGNVLNTLLFKDAVTSPLGYVSLLSPKIKKCSISSKDVNFGPLYVFNDKYIVSYNDELLFILDPINLVAIATVDNLKRIVSIAVNKDEIFVLEGDRSIVRIAYHPDVEVQSYGETLMTRSLLNPLQMAVNSIKDLANSDAKKHISDLPNPYDYFKNIINDGDAAPSTVSDLDIVNGEECFELPPVKQLSAEFDNVALEKLLPNLESINVSQDQEILKREEVMHVSTKRSKRKNIIDIPESHGKYKSSDLKLNLGDADDTLSTNSKTNKSNIMNMSFCGDNLFAEEDKSPETIEKEIAEMEEKLAKVLDLEPVTMSSIKPLSPISLISNGDKSFPSPINEPSNESPKVVKKSVNKKIMKPAAPVSEITPKCVTIPNVWKLEELKVNYEPPNLIAPSLNAPSTNISANLIRKPNRIFDADWELI